MYHGSIWLQDLDRGICKERSAGMDKSHHGGLAEVTLSQPFASYEAFLHGLSIADAYTC